MKQRTSTRTIKLSKAFRTVDEETRRQAAEQRLLSLEHDNYNEQEIVGGAGDDEAVDSDDSTAPKKKRAKKDLKAKKGGENSLAWLGRPVRSLERILMDNGISSDTYSEVNYYTIAAKPSYLPAKRPFCSVCGYLGDYTCTRCGARYCSARCNDSHQETRCLKMSI